MTAGGWVGRVRPDDAAVPATGRRWLLTQIAVGVGGGCVFLHVGTAVAPGPADRPVRALLLVMAAACLPCLRALSRGPSRRVWIATGAMYGAMLAVHLVLMAFPATAGMQHGAAVLSWSELGMWTFLVLASVQLLLVAAALLGHPDRWSAIRR